MTGKPLTYGLVGLLASTVAASVVMLTAKASPQAIAPPDREMPSVSMPALGHGMAQPEQHFIVMMIPHHEDAIAMADLALRRSTHPEIRRLAQAIKTTQTQENQQMRRWYQQWYGTRVPEGQPGMKMRMGVSMRMGMGHDGHCCMRTNLDALKTAPDFDQSFIEEMVPHHQMGVNMAQMVLDRSDRPEIQALAKTIISGQTAEIDQMQYWYREWYQ